MRFLCQVFFCRGRIRLLARKRHGFPLREARTSRLYLSRETMQDVFRVLFFVGFDETGVFCLRSAGGETFLRPIGQEGEGRRFCLSFQFAKLDLAPPSASEG
jgi:hypothetical protein